MKCERIRSYEMYYKDFDYRNCSESPFESLLVGNYKKIK